jgi:hypothetical protein
MITYKQLPGRPSQEALNGITDWFGMPTWVKSYWQTIKNKINDLQQLGFKISTYQQKLGVAKYNLEQRGKHDLAAQLDDEIKKAQDDLDKWWKVKGYIDTYLPSWMQLDQNTGIAAPGSAVGIVPFILAGMALTALAYVVNTGMALLQDYMYKSQLTSAVIEGKMTSGQAAEILSVPKQEGIVEKVVGKVGVGLGFGIPTALAIGVGGYILYTTVLKDLLFGARSS